MNKPMAKMCIILSETLKNEMEHLINTEDLNDVEVQYYQSKSLQGGSDWLKIQKICLDREYTEIHIYDNHSLIHFDPSTLDFSIFHHHLVDSASLEMIAPEELLNYYESQGAYLLKPGSIQNWKSLFERWEFNQQTATDFFHESVKLIVLLNTGVYPNIEKALSNFSRHIDMVSQNIPLGMDYFRLKIMEHVWKWRSHNRIDSKVSKKTLDYSTKNESFSLENSCDDLNNANIAFILDLIYQLTKFITEEQAIQKILEFYMMLFSPNHLYYIPLHEGEFGSVKSLTFSNPSKIFISSLSIIDSQEDFIWIDQEKGFALKVYLGDNIYGFIECTSFAFPQYRDQYLTVALLLSKVCGLIINNARTYQQLNHSNLDLAKSTTELELIIETIPDGILVLEPSGVIRLANNSFKTIFERALNSPLRINSNFCDYQAENLFFQTILRALQEKDELGETIETAPDFWVQIFAKFPRIIDNTDHFAVIIELRNVSPFVEFENIRKQFVSMVSHELRTPITAINLSIQNLLKYRDRISEEQLVKMLSIVEKNATTLSEIIEDLLLISRIEGDRIKLKWRELEIKGLIREIVTQIEPKANIKNIHFQIDDSLASNSQSSIETLKFAGDLSRISQVFRILLDNAVKYSEDNESIIISIIDPYLGEYNRDKDDGILISIQDYGIGLTDKDKLRLFERFFRSENVKNIQGTGLGLSIAHELVNLHGGQIFVESEFEKGSTFSVFLPRNLDKIQ